MKALKQLHGKAKLQYFWDYYKLPFIIICIVLYILVYNIHGQLVKKQLFSRLHLLMLI